MKKLLALAAIAVIPAFVQADEIACGNTMGVLEIRSDKADCIVAVPFAALGGGDAAVANIVKTQNLTVGDVLYTFAPAATKVSEVWQAWTLAESDEKGKYWQSVSTASIGANGLPEIGETPLPDAKTIVPCSAFMLHRQSPGTKESPASFFVYGDYQSTLSIVVKANQLSLVANPLNTSVNILEKIVHPAKGDVIYSISPRAEYRYNGSQWAKKTPPATFDPIASLTIPAGTGVWVQLANDNTFTFR